MTLTEPANPGQPDHLAPDPHHLAVIGVAQWVREDRVAADELEEAMRADSLCREMRRHAEAAGFALADVNARVSSLIDRHNLDGRRTLSFGVGSTIVVALVILDAIPLNWAAQAFGLNRASSWLITLILLAATIAAMAGLELMRHEQRRRTALVGVILAAYAGLIALRTSFLVTVIGESALAALLQAVVLSAISAGLVFVGAAVLARTRPVKLSRASAALRRARRTSESSEAAWRRAEEQLDRHLAVLRRQLVRRPLYTAVPAGVTHPAWAAALESALHAQFAQR
jgi:hypothetical protein